MHSAFAPRLHRWVWDRTWTQAFCIQFSTAPFCPAILRKLSQEAPRLPSQVPQRTAWCIVMREGPLERGSADTFALPALTISPNPSVPNIPWFPGSVTSQTAPSLLCQLQVSEAQELDLRADGYFFSIWGTSFPSCLFTLLQEAEAISLYHNPTAFSWVPDWPRLPSQGSSSSRSLPHHTQVWPHRSSCSGQSAPGSLETWSSQQGGAGVAGWVTRGPFL